MSVPDIGTQAPDFTTKNQYGEDITVSALRGRPVVLVFYPFAFTGICTFELGELRDSLGRLAEAETHLLAVSTDTMFSLRVFDERERLGFDLLTDHWPHGAIASRYGVFDDQLGCARRGTFVLDAHGTLVWSVVNSIGEARELSAVLAELPAG